MYKKPKPRRVEEACGTNIQAQLFACFILFLKSDLGIIC